MYKDESVFEAETIRHYSYAAIGKRCINRYNWQAKKRTNVIGALYEKYCLRLITLNRTSIATYFMAGSNTP